MLRSPPCAQRRVGARCLRGVRFSRRQGEHGPRAPAAARSTWIVSNEYVKPPSKSNTEYRFRTPLNPLDEPRGRVAACARMVYFATSSGTYRSHSSVCVLLEKPLSHVVPTYILYISCSRGGLLLRNRCRPARHTPRIALLVACEQRRAQFVCLDEVVEPVQGAPVRRIQRQRLPVRPRVGGEVLLRRGGGEAEAGLAT